MNKFYKLMLIRTSDLFHIEGFSSKRVASLSKKILKDQIWSKPICIERKFKLVLDGQHRFECAKLLKINYIPCLAFEYNDVELWSLRKNHVVNRKIVIEKAISGNLFPYKTVKHLFPCNIPLISIPLKKLQQIPFANKNFIEYTTI